MSAKKKKSSKKKTVAKPYSKKTNKNQHAKAIKPEINEIPEVSQITGSQEIYNTPDVSKPEEIRKSENHEPHSEDTIMQVREKAPPLPFVFRRFLEFLLPSVLLSVPLEAIRRIKAPDIPLWGSRLSSFALMIFIIISIYLYRVFFFSMGNRKVYFRVNLVSYTIFALASLVVLNYVEYEYIYSFLFTPLKYAAYLMCDIFNSKNWEIYRLPSAIITHIFMYVLIFISPLEMYGIEKKLQKRSK